MPGARLRCLVCRALWVTVLTSHTKCVKFYVGRCDGACGKPHIMARGTVPRGLEATQKEVLLRCRRSLREVVQGRQHAEQLGNVLQTMELCATSEASSEARCSEVSAGVLLTEEERGSADGGSVHSGVAAHRREGGDAGCESAGGLHVHGADAGREGVTPAVHTTRFRFDPYMGTPIVVVRNRD